MTELEIMQRAQMYIDKMANGINPITNQEVEPTDTLNNIRVSRCLFYVSSIIKKVIENHNESINTNIKNITKRTNFRITPEQLSKFKFSSFPIYASKIAEQLNELCLTSNMQKINGQDINNWLLKEGFLKNQVKPNGTIQKVPTEIGINKGIIMEEKISKSGFPYIAIYLKEEMQRLIIEHIFEITENISLMRLQKRQAQRQRRESGETNSGSKWTQEQDNELTQMYQNNNSINEIAINLKRSNSSIISRLKKLELIKEN